MLRRMYSGNFIRFLTVGLLTFSCEYAVFYGLYAILHWNLLLANSLSFGVGLSVSFGSNRLWAFKRVEYKRRLHHQLMAYVSLALTNLILNNIIVATLNALGLDPRIGKVFAIALIAVWNFLIYKHYIFSSSKGAKGLGETSSK
jgi:putative flippase GtrA